MKHALEGLRVLDVTQVMAGPFCAMLLCDMGATVIKVEPPDGDSTRRMAGTSGTDSPSFNAVNRGKRGIVLDLTQPPARDVFRRLAGQSDILIENYRPGVMARFGLDYASLSADHPRLIYASISGYGQTGPHATKGGFDLIAQGVSGIMSITGTAGESPVKVGVPITDLGAGLFALAGILAALYYREHSGRGQHIDTSLLDAGVALSVWEATEFFRTGRPPQPMGSAHRMSAPYQAFRCLDGYITIGGANERAFRKVCAVFEHPEWTDDARFATDAARVQHRAELAALIEAITMAQPRRVWLERLDAAGVPCGPIQDYAEVFADPQVQARELAVDVDHPTFGVLRALGTPLKLSETPLEVRRRAPLLGEHTDEVLGGAGYGEEEIAELRRGGAVG
jgi:crotonobetainyl-CoA:carnitine CoA-transferase CaiB-like acyl-CoA transferase